MHLTLNTENRFRMLILTEDKISHSDIMKAINSFLDVKTESYKTFILNEGPLKEIDIENEVSKVYDSMDLNVTINNTYSFEGKGKTADSDANSNARKNCSNLRKELKNHIMTKYKNTEVLICDPSLKLSKKATA